MTRDKRDSKNEGVLAAVLIFLPCLYIMVEGVWVESRPNLLESALMSKGMEEIMYIIIVYGIIYIHYYYYICLHL